MARVGLSSLNMLKSLILFTACLHAFINDLSTQGTFRPEGTELCLIGLFYASYFLLFCHLVSQKFLLGKHSSLPLQTAKLFCQVFSLILEIDMFKNVRGLGFEQETCPGLNLRCHHTALEGSHSSVEQRHLGDFPFGSSRWLMNYQFITRGSFTVRASFSKQDLEGAWRLRGVFGYSESSNHVPLAPQFEYIVSNSTREIQLGCCQKGEVSDHMCWGPRKTFFFLKKW